MLSSTNPIAAFVTLSLLVVAIGSFWILFKSENNLYLETIDTMERNWLSADIKDYDYTFMEGCMFIEEEHVQVRNGISSNPNAQRSISHVFNQIRNAAISANIYEVEFHPLGFPLNFSVDWDKSVMDDECFISIRNFEIISKDG